MSEAAKQGKSTGRREMVVVLVAAAAIVAVFWPVCGGEFLRWDDDVNVSANSWLNPPTWAALGHFWGHAFEGLYIPLTYTVWTGLAAVATVPATDAAGAALNPYVFHTANLLLHVVAAVMAFKVLRALVPQAWAAAAGALVFAIHPVQVESVAWVTGMKDVLCGLLSLTALWQFLLAQRAGEGRWHYGWATVAYAGALAAKPGAVVVPIIAAIVSRGGPANRWKRPTVILWLLLAACCLAMTMWAQPSRAPGPPIWERPLVAGDALAFYLGKVVWPLHLAIDYGRRPDVVLGHAWGYLTWLIPAGAGLAAAMLRRRVPKVAAGLGVFAVGLLPVLGFVPFDFQGYSTVADHYLYLPMFGVGLVVAAAVERAAGGRGKVAVVVGVLALLGVRSFLQCRFWHDDRAIFSHTLDVNPTSMAGLNGMSRFEWEQGHYGPAARFARELIHAQPQSDLGYIDLGAALRRAGYPDEAVACWSQALARSPQNVSLLVNLALTVSRPGHNERAMEYLRRAAAAGPDDEPTQFNLGAILREDGHMDEAAEHLARAVELAPGDGQARLVLAVALENLNKLPEATVQLRAAVQLRPGDAQARTGLAAALAKQGDLDGAQIQLEKALELDPAFAPARAMLEKIRSLKASGPR